MNCALYVQNLTKKYHKSNLPALDSINLNIKRGSFFGLLGPNGAGKSTLINIISSTISKTSGTIKICDINLDENPKDAKLKIGIVPQELVIDPFFTVYETLEIYSGYYGIKPKHRKTNEIITALGLADKKNVYPRSLSGGMKRRLLVAKALMHDPEVLILDEPTAGVDVELREQLWNYIRKINQSGTTVILTTHYLEEAEELCDEIAFLNKGKIITQDNKENILKLIEYKTLVITSNRNLKNTNIDLGSAAENIIKNNQITIKYHPKKISVDHIISILRNNNIKIQDISTQQPDLEDIFKHIYK